jgi:hypothetical protein
MPTLVDAAANFRFEPKCDFVNSAALDTMGGEPPFAAPARSKVEFANADIGSSPAPYTVNRPLMPSVGNAAVSVPSNGPS